MKVCEYKIELALISQEVVDFKILPRLFLLKKQAVYSKIC